MATGKNPAGSRPQQGWHPGGCYSAGIPKCVYGSDRWWVWAESATALIFHLHWCDYKRYKDAALLVSWSKDVTSLL